MRKINRFIFVFILVIKSFLINANTIGTVTIRNEVNGFLPSEIRIINQDLSVPILVANRYWLVKDLKSPHISLVPANKRGNVFSVDGAVVDSKNIIDVQKYTALTGRESVDSSKLFGELEIGHKFKNKWTFFGNSENGHALFYRIEGSKTQFLITDYDDFKRRMLGFEEMLNHKTNNELLFPFNIGQRVIGKIESNIFSSQSIFSREGKLLNVDTIVDYLIDRTWYPIRKNIQFEASFYWVKSLDRHSGNEELFYLTSKDVFQPITPFGVNKQLIAFNQIDKTFLTESGKVLPFEEGIKHFFKGAECSSIVAKFIENTELENRLDATRMNFYKYKPHIKI